MDEELRQRLLDEIEAFDIEIGCRDSVDYWDVDAFLDKLRDILNGRGSADLKSRPGKKNTMRIHCEKCGEPVPESDACVREEYPRTHLCPECYAEEENYDVEPDDRNYEKVKHLLPFEREEALDFGIFGNCNCARDDEFDVEA